jgi:hypothetical protein
MIGAAIIGFNDFESVNMSMSLIDHRPIGPQNFLQAASNNVAVHDSPNATNENEMLQDLWKQTAPAMVKQPAGQIYAQAIPIVDLNKSEAGKVSKFTPTAPLQTLPIEQPIQQPKAEKKPLTLDLGHEDVILGVPVNLSQPLETPKDPHMFVFEELNQLPVNTQQSYLSREFLTSSHLSLAPFPVIDDLANFTTDKVLTGMELRAPPDFQQHSLLETNILKSIQNSEPVNVPAARVVPMC